MKKRKSVLITILLFASAVVLAGLPVPHAHSSINAVNSGNITNSGYTNQFAIGALVEFDFSNGVSAMFEKISNTLSLKWTQVSNTYPTSGGSGGGGGGGGGGGCPAAHMLL